MRSTKCFRPIKAEEANHYTVRGQYTAGSIGGGDVPGYRNEAGVSPASVTETFVALQPAIDNWRWADVPFFIRSGKHLPKRVTGIAIQFKRTPYRLFAGVPSGFHDRNTIVIRIQPDEGITLKFSSKIPGSTMRMRPVTMDFRYRSSFGGHLTDAYTRLILDCTLGDATLYARGDSVDVAWSLITPIREGWEANPESRVYEYAAGTWGPKQSDDLIRSVGRAWRLP